MSLYTFAIRRATLKAGIVMAYDNGGLAVVNTFAFVSRTMPPFVFTCPQCSRPFQMEGGQPAATTVACPHCGAGVAITLPDPRQDSPTTPPAPSPAVSALELLPPRAGPPAVAPASQQTQAAESIVIREPERVVRQGRKTRELRTLPPEVKRRRRLLQTVVVYVVGIVVLVAVLAILVQMNR
jgi:hypothetical protein